MSRSKIKICCVYKIENISNGKCYVGGTTNYFSRRRQHLYDLRHEKHASIVLQKDYIEFGEPYFSFSILKMSSKDQIEQDEQFWLDALHPAYNTSRFAKKPDDLIVRTEEAVNKISRSIKELWKDPEYRKNRNGHYHWKGGIPNRKGVKLSDETKEKIRQANLGAKNPHYGKQRPQSFVDKVAHTYPGAIDPEGKVYSPIINMSAFCREHGLDNGQMTRLMQGKVVKYKGWTKFIVEGL